MASWRTGFRFDIGRVNVRDLPRARAIAGRLQLAPSYGRQRATILRLGLPCIFASVFADLLVGLHGRE